MVLNVTSDLGHLPKQYVLLVHAPPAKKIYAYSLLEQIHNSIVLVAVSHPAHNIHKTLERLGITKNIHYIDVVSKRIGAGLFLEGCQYLPTADYATLLKAIEHANEQLPIKCGVVLIDSLHHLLLNEDRATALRFIDFLHQRLKVLRMSSILFADLDTLHPDVRGKLQQISDSVVAP